jgi:hypothetical protein
MRELPELPQRLREAADAHRPDRERMLARVERAMAAGGPRDALEAEEPRHPHEPDGPQDPRHGWDRPPAPWMRVTAVAAAVAGAIGLGGLAVGAVTGGGGTAPGQAPAASASGPHGGVQGQEQCSGTSGSAASRGPSVAGHGTAAPGRREPGLTARPGHSAAPPATAGPDAGTGAGTGTDAGHGGGPTPGAGSSGGTVGAPVAGAPSRDNDVSASGTADTANPYWTQSNVRLTIGHELTSLTVELRIAATDGATATGSYCDSGSMSVSISQQGGSIVYRWTLDSGRTLPAGSYTFAGQFQHAQGDRDTSGDSYTVTGSGPDGVSELSGHY